MEDVLDSDLVQTVYDRMRIIADGHSVLTAIMNGEGTRRHLVIVNDGAVPGLDGHGPGARVLVKPDGATVVEFLNFPPPDWKQLMRIEGVEDPVERAEVMARRVCDWLAGFEAPDRFVYRDSRSFASFLAERGEDGIYRERRLTPGEIGGILTGA